MQLANHPSLLPRLAGFGLAMSITTAVLWSFGSEASRQHEELRQAQFQRGTTLAQQSCSLPSSRSLSS